MHIVKDIIYVLMEGNLKRKCIFEYWNYALDDAIFIATRINFNDLNQGNTILHYRNYLYILNLLFFGRCSPNGELYWRDPEPVGGWRGQGGPWPQDVVPVNEQNCNSRTSGSRFVHCPRSFHLFFSSIHVCPLAWPILQTLFRPHENVELLTFMCHIFMYISSWNSASNVSFFPLYIQRRTEIQWMCWG